jgi:hypothetical protein
MPDVRAPPKYREHRIGNNASAPRAERRPGHRALAACHNAWRPPSCSRHEPPTRNSSGIQLGGLAFFTGEFHRDPVDSKIALPGTPEIAVTGGTMFVEKFSGKLAGSDGDKTLSGKISLHLRDGRTLEGTFAVHAVTWG